MCTLETIHCILCDSIYKAPTTNLVQCTSKCILYNTDWVRSARVFVEGCTRKECLGKKYRIVVLVRVEDGVWKPRAEVVRRKKGEKKVPKEKWELSVPVEVDDYEVDDYEVDGYEVEMDAQRIGREQNCPYGGKAKEGMGKRERDRERRRGGGGGGR